MVGGGHGQFLVTKPLSTYPSCAATLEKPRCTKEGALIPFCVILEAICSVDQHVSNPLSKKPTEGRGHVLDTRNTLILMSPVMGMLQQEHERTRQATRDGFPQGRTSFTKEANC